MNIETAIDYAQKGLIWANWSPDQAEAIRTLILEVKKVKQLENENTELRYRLFENK
jgi:hypothetical protein